MEVYNPLIKYSIGSRNDNSTILRDITDDVLFKMHDDILTDRTYEWKYVSNILTRGFRDEDLPKINKIISYIIKDKELRDAILDYVLKEEYDGYGSFVGYIQNLHKAVSNKSNIPNEFNIASDIEEFVESDEFKELERLINDVRSKASIEVSYRVYNDTQTIDCMDIQLGLDGKTIYSTESTMHKTTDGDELKLGVNSIKNEVYSKIKSYKGGHICVTISFNEGNKESCVSAESYAPKLFRKGFTKKDEIQFKTDGAEELVKILKKRHVNEYVKYCSDPYTWSPSIAEPEDVSEYITDLRYLAAVAEIIDENKDENGKISLPDEYIAVKDKLIKAGWPIQQ